MHHITILNWSSAITLVLCAVAATACDPTDDALPEPGLAADEQLATPEEEAEQTPREPGTKRYVGGDTIQEVILDGGTRVSFVAITSTSGEVSVGALEEIPRGAVSLADFEALAGAGVRDVFWAVTEPGTPMPAQLAAIQGGDEELGPQGWALDVMANGDIVKPRAVCDADNTFSNYVTSKGFDTDILRLNKHPDESSLFIPDSYAPGNGQSYDGYMYSPNGTDSGSRFFNIDEYYTRVGACRLSGHYIVNDWHIGPMINFDYRDSNDNGWYTAFSVDVDWGDDDVTFAWLWQSGTGWDWRTRIEMAAWDDIYDIGHAYSL